MTVSLQETCRIPAVAKLAAAAKLFDAAQAAALILCSRIKESFFRKMLQQGVQSSKQASFGLPPQLWMQTAYQDRFSGEEAIIPSIH